MDIKLPKYVGNVKIDRLGGANNDSYQDKAEDLLLSLFSEENPLARRQEIMNSQPDWAIYYHLSEKRANLLRWYDFKKDARVLEVGAGCGAITEGLVKKNINVVALELTQKRALINAYRNKSATNLEVIVGNLQDYKPKTKFDYIVCVGVLEYSGSFIDSNSPYQDFLKMLRSLLKDEGKLMLAIENRLGMKYLSGAKEDHTGSFFDGINRYPSGKKVQTFGKKELTKILTDTGFSKLYFYYPFPDYKTPSIVYSDDYHPGHNASFPVNLLPSPTLDRPRYHIFSEQRSIKVFEDNGLFPDLTNSFLVEANK